MRLKQIKLAGFKSFVDPTVVPFPQPMTAVVGPNGCGKSNVIDAVRWVLGESSAKNLRGDAMTDVIFNGSAQRKPVSQASVELVFENTQGRLSGNMADRSEISVRRVVTRDAQSTYFLNGTKCRRRDITDIFLGTGLGPRSYAIIEQGMISRLIESKPQELRIFIEEAAGISKYKERRRETENRIRHTRDNLDRLSDVREELGKNIEKLKRQASAAQRYKELKAQERKLKAEVTTIRWLKYNNQLTALEQQLQQQETELEKYQSSQLGDQKVLLELKEQAITARQDLEQLQSRFYQLGTTITRLEQQILHQRQQRQTLTTQLQQGQQALREAETYIAAEQSQLSELAEQIAEDTPELELAQEQLAELQLQLAQTEDSLQHQQQQFQQWQQAGFRLQQQKQQQQLQLQNQQQQLTQLHEQQQQLQQEMQELAESSLLQHIAEAELQQEQLQQQLAISSAATEQQELLFGEHEQHRQQLQEQRQQQANALHLLQQEQQRLLQLQHQQSAEQQQLLQQLQIAPGWALAVAVALGQLQHAALQPATEQLPDASVVWQPDVAAKPGTLASVIEAGIYPGFFNRLLLADNYQQARQILTTLADGESVICRDGSWLGSNWLQIAGASQQDNFLLRQERLQQLEQELETQQLLLNDAEQQLIACTQQLEHSKQQVHQCRVTQAEHQRLLQQQETTLLLRRQEWQQLQKQQLRLAAELDQIQLRQAQLEESTVQLELQLEQTTAELLEHDSSQQQLTGQQSILQQNLSGQRQQVEQQRQREQQLLVQLNGAQRQQQTLQQSILRSKQQIEQLTLRLQTTEEQLNGDDEPELVLHEQLQEALLAREDAEQALAAQQNLLAGLEQQMRELEQGQQGIMHLVNQKRKALEDLRLDSEGYRVRANNMLELLQEQQANMKDVLAELPADAEEEPWQQQLDKTIDAVSRLGPINLAAIEEYEQQAERKGYLDTQHDDLTAALETLETAIRKIDKETRQKFRETFDLVNDGLKGLFPKVFGGGSAYLELTEDDLLETGVTIMARPPGKKNSTIHLLSGGEKALTALSLVFSIFRLNPAPFCMLDEVDAPLDDANVGRFCNLVREMSETVQFIYISHNKIAMEMAAQLMGVTMQEPGVSRVVAVDVEDAVKMAAAS